MRGSVIDPIVKGTDGRGTLSPKNGNGLVGTSCQAEKLESFPCLASRIEEMDY